MTTAQKTCFKCKQTKPLTEFYVHPQMGDGRLNKCKTCTKRDVSDNYRANIGHYKAYEADRLGLPHRVLARSNYAKTPQGIQAARRGSRMYDLRYPEKKAATVAVNNAVRDGRLFKKVCEVCADPKAQAHHDDYSKPLDVRWLCVKHHAQHHRKIRKQA